MNRNDKCNCGSGKKYKKCCIDKEEKLYILKKGVKLYMFGNGPKPPMKEVLQDIKTSEGTYAIETYVGYAKRNDTTKEEVKKAYNELEKNIKSEVYIEEIYKELEELIDNKKARSRVLESAIGREELIEEYKNWAQPWIHMLNLGNINVTVLDVLGIEDTLKQELEQKLLNEMTEIGMGVASRYKVKVDDLINNEKAMEELRTQVKKADKKYMQEYIDRVVEVARAFD